MTCKLCIERGQTWSGDAPRCGWPLGTETEPFSEKNWNCATANKLRSLAGEGDTWGSDPQYDHWYLRAEDQSYAAIYVPEMPRSGPPWDESDDLWSGGGMIAMTWYKSRGHTEQILRIDSDGARPLTLLEAEQAIRNVEAVAALPSR